MIEQQHNEHAIQTAMRMRGLLLYARQRLELQEVAGSRMSNDKALPANDNVRGIQLHFASRASRRTLAFAVEVLEQAFGGKDWPPGLADRVYLDYAMTKAEPIKAFVAAFERAIAALAQCPEVDP